MRKKNFFEAINYERTCNPLAGNGGGNNGRLLPVGGYRGKGFFPRVFLPLDGGGRGGGDFHPSLCPTRAWGLFRL